MRVFNGHVHSRLSRFGLFQVRVNATVHQNSCHLNQRNNGKKNTMEKNEVKMRIER